MHRRNSVVTKVVLYQPVGEFLGTKFYSTFQHVIWFEFEFWQQLATWKRCRRRLISVSIHLSNDALQTRCHDGVCPIRQGQPAAIEPESNPIGSTSRLNLLKKETRALQTKHLRFQWAPFSKILILICTRHLITPFGEQAPKSLVLSESDKPRNLKRFSGREH
jgi:hypothetical protein